MSTETKSVSRKQRPSSSTSTKTTNNHTKEEYQKLALHDQILLRPDTYIGSTHQVTYSDPVWISRNGIIVRDKVKLSEGLIQLFNEIISNALDNVKRSEERKIPCSFIKVSFDKSTNKITVWNDGNPIPVRIHSEEKVYIPELIFGHLLTSSNYDDSKERMTSGRNGIGAKGVCIFSSRFEIEIFDPETHTIYTQKWEQNMKRKYPPSLRSHSTSMKGVKGGYTKVSWIPDFSRLGVPSYDTDSWQFLEKRVYDTAMLCVPYRVKVYLNDELILMNSMKDYALRHYHQPPSEILYMKSQDCDVILTPYHEFVHESFVNGAFTMEGGVHVDAWSESVFRPIVDRLNGVKNEKQRKKTKEEKKETTDKKKKKQPLISIKDVRPYFALFVSATVDKPTFPNQTKTRLTSPEIHPEIKSSDIDKLMKWEFVQKIKDKLKFKDMNALDKMGKRRGWNSKVTHANFARNPNKKKEREECIFCVTEGDSAESYITGGIEYGIMGKKGHDYIGIFPLRGKFLNVRNSSTTIISKNKEVETIIEALGLQSNTDYTVDENRKTLRYGKLLVCADSDVDGIHIVGLLYNFFHTLYPSLLKLSGFFHFLRTPIVKVDMGDKILPFYYLSQAHEFINEHRIRNTKRKQRVQYLKGLGSSRGTALKEDFKRNKVVQLELGEDGDDMVDKVFNKSHAEFRKTWITSFDEKQNTIQSRVSSGLKQQLERLSVSAFLNQELRVFSVEDCERSIPSLEDGLKQSQRKILYSAFLRNMTFTGQSIKVSRFSQWAAGDTNYHHGENGLDDTLIKMAQRFVGSNNIPLFYDDGNFGSRLKNGEDCSAGRYPFTKLDFLTRDLFPKEDDRFLENILEEGMKIEKKVYIPILPLILVNGCMGIGTGFSSTIPSYNPLDLVEWIRTWIRLDGHVMSERNGTILSETNRLIPWWRGFKGTIEMVDETKVITHGVVSILNEEKNSVLVTELPIGKRNISISKFKEMLDEMVEAKTIHNYEIQGNNNIVKFIVYGNESMKLTEESLGLTDYIHTSNMVLFSTEHRLQRYRTVEEILSEFCVARLRLYSVRKQGILRELREELKYTKNKIRFIEEVESGTLVLKNKEEEEIDTELDTKRYDRKPVMGPTTTTTNESLSISEEEEKDENDEEEKKQEEEKEKTNLGTFDYLLGLTYQSSTKSKFQSMIHHVSELETQILTLESTSEKQLWVQELDRFEQRYEEWVSITEQEMGEHSVPLSSSSSSRKKKTTTTTRTTTKKKKTTTTTQSQRRKKS